MHKPTFDESILAWQRFKLSVDLKLVAKRPAYQKSHNHESSGTVGHGYRPQESYCLTESGRVRLHHLPATSLGAAQSEFRAMKSIR